MVFINAWVVALTRTPSLLTGVGTMLFSVIYTLVPLLTKLEFKHPKLVDWHLWLWLIGSVSMAYAMGMAGSNGMIRRTLYTGGEFSTNTLAAFIGGSVVSIGFVLFLINLVSTIGLKNVLSLVLPDRKARQPDPLQAPAQYLHPIKERNDCRATCGGLHMGEYPPGSGRQSRLKREPQPTNGYNSLWLSIAARGDTSTAISSLQQSFIKEYGRSA